MFCKMKKQCIFLILFFFSLQIKAQNNIPAKTAIASPYLAVNIFKVTDVVLSIDSSVHETSGAGAIKDYFKVVINSIGKGTIQYQWVAANLTGYGNNPGSNSYTVKGTIETSSTGRDVIFAERDHVTHNGNKKFILQIISPTQINSNQIEY